jgi:cell division protein FtsX
LNRQLQHRGWFLNASFLNGVMKAVLFGASLAVTSCSCSSSLLRYLQQLHKNWCRGIGSDFSLAVLLLDQIWSVAFRCAAHLYIAGASSRRRSSRPCNILHVLCGLLLPSQA